MFMDLQSKELIPLIKKIQNLIKHYFKEFYKFKLRNKLKFFYILEFMMKRVLK